MAKKKKIALDATCICNYQTGAGNVALSLIKYFALNDTLNEYYIFIRCDLVESHPLFQHVPTNNFQPIRISSPAVGPLKQLAFLLFYLKNKLIHRFYDFDFVHSFNWDPPLVFYRHLSFTIHDLKYLVIENQLAGFSKIKYLYMLACLKVSCKIAKRIFVPSQASLNDTIKIFDVDPHKLEKTYWGFEKNVIEVDTRMTGQGDKIILFVGEKRPHKNIIGILHGFSRFLKHSLVKAFKLVLVGRSYSNTDSYLRLARELKISSKVSFVENVDDFHLVQLYAESFIFLFPSLYEGFGIPILEAMAHGLPVVTSNTSSMPEVAGNAAILVSPTRYSEIADALTLFAFDEDERLRHVALGYERVQLFDWSQCSLAYIEYFNKQ